MKCLLIFKLAWMITDRWTSVDIQIFSVSFNSVLRSRFETINALHSVACALVTSRKTKNVFYRHSEYRMKVTRQHKESWFVNSSIIITFHDNLIYLTCYPLYYNQSTLSLLLKCSKYLTARQRETNVVQTLRLNSVRFA